MRELGKKNKPQGRAPSLSHKMVSTCETDHRIKCQLGAIIQRAMIDGKVAQVLMGKEGREVDMAGREGLDRQKGGGGAHWF